MSPVLQLKIGHAFAQDLPFERLPVCGLHLSPHHGERRIARHRREGSDVADQRRHLIVCKGKGRHPFRGSAFPQECSQLGVAARCDLRHDSGTGFAAGGIASVTAGAAAFEVSPPGAEVLRGSRCEHSDEGRKG